MLKFTNGVEISWDKLILLGVLLGQIVWNIAVLPQQISANLTPRFAQKIQVDKLAEDISYMRGRIDRVYEILHGR